MAIAGIALAAQAAFGLGQAIIGGKRKREAPDLPTYDVSSEAYQNLSHAERMAMEGLPEAQKREYIENVHRTSATSLQQAGTRKGGLGLVPGVARQEREGWKSLLSMDAQARMENANKVFAMRDKISQEKFMKFQADTERAKILRGEADALTGAGIQNIAGAIGSSAALSSMFGEGEGFDLGIKDWLLRRKKASNTPLTKVASKPTPTGVAPNTSILKTVYHGV